MRCALVTGVYGGYDPVRALPEDHGFDDVVCVTDGRSEIPDGWRVVEERPVMTDRLAAKRPKMMPWMFTDCDAAIWVDASFEVLPGFGDWARAHFEFGDFVVWHHPEGRLGIEQEAEVCWFFDKYKEYPIREQAKHYLDDGLPPLWGLFACGVLGWKFNDQTRALGERWWFENNRWSVQDQISLPYLLWDSGMPFALWQANEYDNPYIRLRWDERPRPRD